MKVITQNLSLINKGEESIITLEQAKKYIKIDHDDDDNMIMSFIKASQEEVESIINKNILVKKWKYDIEIPVGKEDGYINFDFSNLSHSTIKIPLTQKPILNIVEVATNKSLIDKDDYAAVINTVNPVLCVKSKALIGCAENKKIAIHITYETGMYKNVNDVQEKIKLAILMLTSSKYTERNFDYVFSKPKSKRYVKSLLSSFIDYHLT